MAVCISHGLGVASQRVGVALSNNSSGNVWQCVASSQHLLVIGRIDLLSVTNDFPVDGASSAGISVCVPLDRNRIRYPNIAPPNSCRCAWIFG